MSELNKLKFENIQVPTELENAVKKGIEKALPAVKKRYYGATALKITTVSSVMFLLFIVGRKEILKLNPKTNKITMLISALNKSQVSS